MKLVSVETPEKSVCKMTFSASPEERGWKLHPMPFMSAPAPLIRSGASKRAKLTVHKSKLIAANTPSGTTPSTI